MIFTNRGEGNRTDQPKSDQSVQIEVFAYPKVAVISEWSEKMTKLAHSKLGGLMI